MAKNKSGYDVYYDFEYRGHKEPFDYDIPFETFMKGVVKYFDDNMVTLDGKDTDVWNILYELDCLDEIFDKMEDWFKEHCKEDAYEEYKEYIDWYYDEDEEGQ